MTGEPRTDWTYLTLSLDTAVLPAWFDIVQRVCAAHVHRMMVIERPDAWIVRVEIAPENSAQFQSELAAAWELFAAQRRAVGDWQEIGEA
jgi:hypothetical protein